MTTEEIRQLALEAAREKLRSQWIDCLLRIRAMTQNPGECGPLQTTASIREECATIEQLVSVFDNLWVGEQPKPTPIRENGSEPVVIDDFEYLQNLVGNAEYLKKETDRATAKLNRAFKEPDKYEVQLSTIDQDCRVVGWHSATKERVSEFPLARFRIVRATP